LSKLKLRPHQNKAINSAEEEFFNCGLQSGMICLPTGGGKTITAAKFVADSIKNGKIKNCLWLVHRQELCDQAYDTFIYFGCNTAKWTATVKEVSDVTVCMVQSARNLTRKCKTFDLIIVDEAHHFATSEDDYENSYSKLIGRIEYKHLLGLTATPTRLDRRALNFEKAIYSTTFYDMVKEGYLAKPDYFEIRTDKYYQLSKNSKADFTQKSLGSLDDPERNKKIASEWYKQKDTFGKTLVFCVSINHCNTLMSEFKKLDRNIICKVITGETDKSIRLQTVKDFDKGNIDIVFNCQVFTEGFDCPSINTILVARPTMSETLFMQMIGRGARILPNKHSYNIIVVVDDVQRFATIVKTWKPLLIGKSKEDIEQELFQQQLEEAKVDYERVAAENDIKVPLKDMKAIDVEAILSISTKYKYNIGFVLDRDRNDCLRRLFQHTKNLQSKGDHSIDSILESYTYCVPVGEFNQKEWETICWGYFLRYRRQQNTVTVNENGSSYTYDIWKRIPLVEFTEEDRKEISKRIESSLDISELKNQDFNENYSLDNGIKLYTKLIQMLKEQEPKKYKNCSVALDSIKKLSCRNRNLIIETYIYDKSRFNIGQIANASKNMTIMLQTLLSDPCCKVRFKMERN